MNELSLIYNRHSVRKFTNDPIPTEHIKEIIKAATYAPSGKNVQNWHFVVITDKNKIEEIAQIVEKKNAQLAEQLTDENMKKNFTKFVRFSTLFRKAPVLILVYAGPYTPTGLDVLQQINASNEEIHTLLRPNPAIQNIGAAVQNLMLAATQMGYGTCWMTSSNYAAKEIESFVGFEKEGYFLSLLTPLGVPDGELKSPSRKPIEEIMTII
ncbi:nitroreductase family protein [Lutibacter sp. B2]|nr:nitroreductase family protein [Lutibacter sp. B2]